ncbi:methyltransferase domain-containing protein, partial [bacterium]|nr:methyltransferase domain-containing protein [bacterium]
MLLRLLKAILKKKSLARALMDISLKEYTLNGKVLDLGGGKKSKYFYFVKREKNCELINLDCKAGDKQSRLDFEVDSLPFSENYFDQILILNLLEHIFNYKLLMREACRVLKKGGRVIGFVPFLVNVHPDPHDFFRYTKESLEKIFAEAGFNKIEIVEIGRGPFAVNFNNIVLSIPVLARVIFFPIYYFLDWIFIKLRPTILK